MSDSGKDARVAWVKLGKIWWPGKVLKEDDFTDEIKADLAARLSRKNSVKPDQIYVVQFFNEDAYEIVFKPNEILLDVTEEKKHDLMKKALSSMTSSTLADNKTKFKADVLEAERHLNPSADLSNLTKLLDGEILERKSVGVSKYADIFPTIKPEKPSPVTPSSTGKGKAGAIKFNFPSSRIISKASSKPPSKISPLPSDPSKKFKCGKCAFSADRVNVITAHMRYCSGNTAPSLQQKKATSTASSSLPTGTASTPVPSPKKVATPAPTPTTPLASAPAPRKPGRPPRKSVTPVTPAVASPSKSTTPVSATTPTSPPKKRGRRSKKDKQLSEKQKAEILQDWKDSSSEENDSDDDLAPMMPPTKPPELFLFGSEKNKKRKADIVDEKVDTISSNNEAVASTVATNEDEPPVLKKPRTDKELSDAFDSLLKTTKMELPTWEEKAGEEETDEEGEKMEVENEAQLSDIEEDANILMKKIDNVEEADEAPILQKESLQTEAKANEKNKKESEKPVLIPPTTTNGQFVKEKKEEQSTEKPEVKIDETSLKKPEVRKDETKSKKPEEKKTSTKKEENKPAIMTRRSTRSMGGATTMDTEQIEATLKPALKASSPKKSIAEVPAKQESPKKVQSTKEESKVHPVSTSNAENKDEEKAKAILTKTKPIPSSPKKNEKTDSLPSSEPKKTGTVPEENVLASPKSAVLEASLPAPGADEVLPAAEPVKETKQSEKKISTSESEKPTTHPIPAPAPSTVPASSPTKTKQASVATVKATSASSAQVHISTDLPATASLPQAPTSTPTSVPVPKVLPVAVLSPPVPKVASPPMVPNVVVPSPLPTSTAPLTSTSVVSPVVKPIPEITNQPPPPPVVIASKSAPKPPSPKKKVDEKKVATTIPAAPIIASVKSPPVGSQPKPINQPPQKKPTAAVRPLVDTKEVPPLSVNEGKGTAIAAPSKGSHRDQPQSQTASGHTIVSQQQEVDGEESGKKSPTLVAQRVVHLVPVENQDGTITYMLLSLENGNENPNVVLEQGVDQSNTVLRVDKVEPMDQSTPPNVPLNPNEVEGLFLDKNVNNANQIVSALAQGTQGMAQSTTTTTSMMDATTTYVTLAMDAMGDSGASGSDALAAAGLMQQSVVNPEGATTTTQDSSGETQQVFYMTEDGSILDPQSLGLTLEQLQQLLNQ